MPIVVKKNGFQISDTEYTINYINGVITFTTAYAASLDESDLITASYNFLTIEVIDGYPYDRLNSLSLVTISRQSLLNIWTELMYPMSLGERKKV